MKAQMQFGGFGLDLSRPRVMGVLNVTPDSFSDGGRFLDTAAAIRRVREMVAEGADIIDIGGESTRPGAEPVPVEQELERVLPVIRAIAPECRVPISVDTSKPEVMRAAVEAGASLINDVYGLRMPGAPEAAAACGVPVCIMHMQGEPRTMQANPQYADVVADVSKFLGERVNVAIDAGVSRDNILLDPGFGFGKSVDHNLELLARLGELRALGRPLLVGLSRKSLIGKLTGAPADQRLPGSLALAVLAASAGAAIVRVHDVAATVQALTVAQSVSTRRK
ncbi:MAG: dihydropteroate synthase [Gammaproteobacteria bacterium]|jgi:dihydropteroate synthase